MSKCFFHQPSECSNKLDQEFCASYARKGQILIDHAIVTIVHCKLRFETEQNSPSSSHLFPDSMSVSQLIPSVLDTFEIMPTFPAHILLCVEALE